MSLIGKQFESTFGSYKVTDVLGEGGSGRVLAVVDDQGKAFALKVLAGERVSKEKTKRFQNELAFCERENHPAILRVVDYGHVTEGGKKLPFYVMPLYRETLRTYIKGRTDPDISLKTFVRILDGVEAAHLLKVWHRDLKPENLLFDKNPAELVVADFGIAHFAEDLLATTVETREDARMANFAYAAPEQRQVGGRVDFRADIFALGLILSELFTQELPLGKEHKKIASVAPQYAYLDALADEMLRQSPEARPQSIGKVKDQLIARGNEFVAKQRLDEIKRAVVQASAPPDVPDFSFTTFDYRDNALLIMLDQSPPPGWFELFQNPPGGHSAIMGSGPELFQLQGRLLSVPVEEQYVETVVEYARDYARKASIGMRQKLARIAAEREREQREVLRKQVAEAEKRQRVLARLAETSKAG